MLNAEREKITSTGEEITRAEVEALRCAEAAEEAENMRASIDNAFEKLETQLVVVQNQSKKLKQDCVELQKSKKEGMVQGVVGARAWKTAFFRTISFRSTENSIFPNYLFPKCEKVQHHARSTTKQIVL